MCDQQQSARPPAAAPRGDRPSGEPAALRVGAWMTSPVRTVSPDTLVRDAYLLMFDAEIHHLPVVADGHLVGIVTSVDIAPLQPQLITPALQESPNYALATFAVHEIMTTPPITVTPETPVPTAAALMLARRIHALPVVGAAGQLVGIISQTDLLRLLSTLAV